MCWTTTTPGEFLGSLVNTFFMASVPPVEAPMAIILLVVAARDFDSMASKGFVSVFLVEDGTSFTA